MALFLGIKEGELIESRMTHDFIESCRSVLFGKLSSLDAHGQVDLLKTFISRLDEEIGLERKIAREVEAAAATLDQDDSDLLAIHKMLNKAAASHFEHIRSVLSVQAMVSMYRDLLIRRCLFAAEKEMAGVGSGFSPGSYACLVAGNAGRLEATLTPDVSLIMIHAEDHVQEWFVRFSDVFANKAAAAGLSVVGIGILNEKRVFTASRDRWRRVIGDLVTMEEENGILQLLNDARHVYGDLALSAELRRLTRESLNNAGLLNVLAKKAALMPVALGFWGRIKIERSGPHRGECNITRSAIAPLVATVRVMSLMAGITETNTAKRIKLLVDAGRLDVDMAERLLQAYHDFYRLKIQIEVEDGADASAGFVTVEHLSEQDEEKLRSGLETVVNLEKIIYSMVAA